MSLANITSKYFNLVLAAIYAYAIYYDFLLSEKYNIWPVTGKYWSKFVWLTIINLYLHFIYNSIAAIFALLNVQNMAVLRPFHFCATSLVFPCGITVVSLFWGLVYLDPNFLVNDATKIMLAIKWFNHTIHTLPLAAMLLDFILWRHPRPAKGSAFKAIFFFVLLYMIDIHYFYYVHNFWAYPILAVLPAPARLLFLLFCTVFIFGAFLIGDSINKLINQFAPTPRPISPMRNRNMMMRKRK